MLIKKFLFGLAWTTIATVVLLGGLEGGLRLARVGFDPTFYRQARDADGQPIVRENRWVTAPYFSSNLVRRPHPFRLPVEKPASAYRIFVLGSSAAMGDPEPSFSIARLLDELLSSAYPEIRFEVVNAGITAVNSHVVRHIAADCAALQPDVFIVYEGHNEVIGPFGPATVFTPFLPKGAVLRTVDAFRRSRTGQWVTELGRDRGNDGDDWRGMQMFLDQQIAFDDPRLTAVRENFRANLRAIADSAREAGAVMFACTVLTNQRDFAPFLSRHRAGLRASEEAEWRAAVTAGDRELEAGRVAVAAQRYREALAIDDEHAELTFKLARLTLGQGRTSDAQKLFQRALDLDTLRFRADSGLNEVVRGLTGTNLHVVDLERAAAAASAGGIVGGEFLLEHVHLTFSGAYFVALELFQHISEDLLRRGRAPRAVREPLPVEDVRRRLAYTAYEQAMIIRELLDRYNRPPFTGQLDHVERVRALAQREASALRLLAQADTRQALATSYERAIAQDPDDWVLQRNYGMALIAHGAAAEALGPLERARRVIDDDAPTLFALGLAQQKLGQAEAEKTFARLRELEPRYPGLPPAVGPAGAVSLSGTNP
jgi:tetratricopeptide (TPR) repeat protein